MKKSNAKNPKGIPGQRQLRVSEQIRHGLSDVLRRGHFRDPFLADNACYITITSVDIGPDLKNAAAYIIPLGKDNIDEFLEALNRASAYFRTELAKRSTTRHTPKISFKMDHSFHESAKIEGLLRNEKVARDLSKQESDDQE